MGMKNGCVVLTGFRTANACVYHPGVYNIDPDVQQIKNLLFFIINLPKSQFRSIQKNSIIYYKNLYDNNIVSVFE